MIPIAIRSLMEQASYNATLPNNFISNLRAIIISPYEQLQAITVVDFTGIGDYTNVSGHSEVIKITCRYQPGLYQNRIAKYADQLEMEVYEIVGLQQTSRRYRCIPRMTGDSNVQGNSTTDIMPEVFDTENMIDVEFQLIPIDYDILINVPISNNYLVCDVWTALHNTLVEYYEENEMLKNTGEKKVQIEFPLDNDEVYPQVSIRQGLRLKDLVDYLQQNYGVYCTGAGMFFRNKVWYVYTPYRTEGYEQAAHVLDIIRVPQDIIPALEHTYYRNETTTTVISTGPAGFKDYTNVDQQIEGTGKQLISSEAVAGEAGSYYNNGRNVLTREDTLTEYRLAERRDNNDKVLVNPKPTNNVCHQMSQSVTTNGVTLTLSWDNANPDVLIPGMPVRYYYLDKTQVLKIAEGRLIQAGWRYFPNGIKPVLDFRRKVNMVVYFDKTSFPEDPE